MIWTKYDFKVKVNLEELKNTLYFIRDKVDPVYQREVREVIQSYLEECIKENHIRKP